MNKVMLAATLLLCACEPLPIAAPTVRNPMLLSVYPIPSCIIFCTASISAIREDLISTGDAPITSGAKSNTQTGTASSSRQ